MFGPDDTGYDVNKQHGLIVTLENQGAMDVLENLRDVKTKALGSSIGDDLANTVLILSVQGEGKYAANICADYEITEKNVLYDDWFLPSQGELFEIYEKIDLKGEFNTTYWTSTEEDRNAGAWRQNLFNSTQNGSKKIRTFFG